MSSLHTKHNIVHLRNGVHFYRTRRQASKLVKLAQKLTERKSESKMQANLYQATYKSHPLVERKAWLDKGRESKCSRVDHWIMRLT